MEGVPKGIGQFSRIIGLDLAKKTFKGCILTEEKNFEDRKIITGEMDPEGRMHFITGMVKAGDLVAMEGGTSSFNFAREIMEYSEAAVVVLNPGKLHKAFESQIKTDRLDAVRIAHYVRDTKPSSWCAVEVPTEEESELRAVINSYNLAKKDRTMNINKLHATFNQNGIPFLKKSDLQDNDSRIGNIARDLSGMAMQDACLTEARITLIERQLSEYIGMMRQALMSHPEVSLVWLSFPGIRTIVAASLLAYIGDGSRFFSASQLRNYVGLVPMVQQSGDYSFQGNVSWRGCKPVRKSIIQGAWSIESLKANCPLRDEWKALEARHKRKSTIAVHIANKILSLGWVLLRKKELYNGFGDYSRLMRKLREEGLGAIDCSMFPELMASLNP